MHDRDHERRQRAIHQMALEHAASSATPESHQVRLGRSARPRQRWLLRLIIGVIMLALVVGGLGFALTRGSAPHSVAPPSVRTIALGQVGLGCPSAMAFSPDGARLAVLGSAGACDVSDSSASGPHDMVLIYSTLDSAAPRRIDLTATFAAADHEGPGGVVPGAIAWSPDGKLLAVPATFSSQRVGLLLVPVSAGHARVLSAPMPPYARGTGFPLGAVVWDTVTGTGRIISQPLPAAVSYTFGRGGSISPSSPLPSGNPVGIFTGSPATSASSNQAAFSFWQAGAVIFVAAHHGIVTAGSPPMFTSEATVWSADGHYVVFDLELDGALANASPQQLAQLQPTACQPAGLQAVCPTVRVPYPDRALAAVERLAASQIAPGSPASGMPALVAWRPDGQVLAAVLPADGFTRTNGTLRVTFFDTRTGARLGEVSAETRSSANGTAVPYFCWSPDGRHVALLDAGEAHLIIWSGTSLPAPHR